MNWELSLEQRPNHKPRRKKYFINIILVSICFIFACLRSTRNLVGGRNLSGHRATLPELESTDVIFQPDRWDGAIVAEEYKLVFFPIDKVGCSEWKLLFRRIMGFPRWNPKQKLFHLHDPDWNGLQYLANYSEEEAQEMLTSITWTRAVFVREPKGRILSAFLDKFVNHFKFFKTKCCVEALASDFEAQQDCIDRAAKRRDEEDFSYFLRRALDCPNSHWNTQASAIDFKWWQMITFVGYMDNAAADAEKLLKSVTSSRGTTAWDDYASTGWGEDGTSAFMTKRSTPHTTDSHIKARDYYSKCDEAFVEKYWAEDWEHDMYHFEKNHLLDNEDLSDCTNMII
jgi:hypothetical protein